MNKFLRSSIVCASLILSAKANALNSMGATIDFIATRASDNIVYFETGSVDAISGTKPACGSSLPKRYIIDNNTVGVEGAKKMYANLLAAKLQNRKVEVVGTNTCLMGTEIADIVILK